MDNEVTTEAAPPPEDAPAPPPTEPPPEPTPTTTASAPVSASLFRTVYRDLTADEQALIADIKAKAQELEALIAKAGQFGYSRYTSMAVTHLEQSVMWIVKHITG